MSETHPKHNKNFSLSESDILSELTVTNLQKLKIVLGIVSDKFQLSDSRDTQIRKTAWEHANFTMHDFVEILTLLRKVIGNDFTFKQTLNFEDQPELVMGYHIKEDDLEEIIKVSTSSKAGHKTLKKLMLDVAEELSSRHSENNTDKKYWELDDGFLYLINPNNESIPVGENRLIGVRILQSLADTYPECRELPSLYKEFVTKASANTHKQQKKWLNNSLNKVYEKTPELRNSISISFPAQTVKIVLLFKAPKSRKG